MILFGIAAVIAALAALLCGAAMLCRALGIQIPQPERELTEEEKQALVAQAEASRSWSAACNSLVFGAMPYGGGDSRT